MLPVAPIAYIREYHISNKSMEYSQLCDKYQGRRTQGLMKHHFAFDYMICFDQQTQDGLLKLKEHVTTQPPSGTATVKIIQIPTLDFGSESSLARTFSSISTQLRTFAESELKLGVAPLTLAGGRYRTKHFRIQKHWDKDIHHAGFWERCGAWRVYSRRGLEGAEDSWIAVVGSAEALGKADFLFKQVLRRYATLA